MAGQEGRGLGVVKLGPIGELSRRQRGESSPWQSEQASVVWPPGPGNGQSADLSAPRCRLLFNARAKLRASQVGARANPLNADSV